MPLEDGIWIYILRCADGSYYTGLTRRPPEERVAEHAAGEVPGYTQSRRPVSLVYAAEFQQLTDAIDYERQIKSWSRAKKEALIKGRFDVLRELAKRRS